MVERLSAESFSFMWRVLQKYRRTCLSFPQSSFSGRFKQVVRKEEGDGCLDVTLCAFAEEWELRNSVMEGLGLLLGEELGFLFVMDCEEIVYSWGGAYSGDCLGEVVNDFCCVFAHRYLCNAGLGEIKVHSKVVVSWSSVDNEAVAIYYGKIGFKLSDLEGFNM
jgi:hypothetical protein